MGMLPTGVTVVAAGGPDGPAGATANAVCSLSIEPMLMLACLDRGSRTLLAVQAANRFGISVLHAGQEPIARAFATKAPVADKWQGVDWSERDGVPAIDDALVFLACELHDVIAGGDHVIVTGAVTALETTEGTPLVFHGGDYRPLELSDLGRQARKGPPVAAGGDRQSAADLVHALAGKAGDRLREESHERPSGDCRGSPRTPRACRRPRQAEPRSGYPGSCASETRP